MKFDDAMKVMTLLAANAPPGNTPAQLFLDAESFAGWWFMAGPPALLEKRHGRAAKVMRVWNRPRVSWRLEDPAPFVRTIEDAVVPVDSCVVVRSGNHELVVACVAALEVLR